MLKARGDNYSYFRLVPAPQFFRKFESAASDDLIVMKGCYPEIFAHLNALKSLGDDVSIQDFKLEVSSIFGRKRPIEFHQEVEIVRPQVTDDDLRSVLQFFFFLHSDPFFSSDRSKASVPKNSAAYRKTRPTIRRIAGIVKLVDSPTASGKLTTARSSAIRKTSSAAGRNRE